MSQTLLLKITQAVHQKVEADVLLELALGELGSAVSVDRLMCFGLKNHLQHQQVELWQEWPSTIVQCSFFNLQDCTILKQAWESVTELLEFNRAQVDCLEKTVHSLWRPDKFAVSLIAPLLVWNNKIPHVLGWLVLQKEKPLSFTSWERELVQAVASHISIGMTYQQNLCECAFMPPSSSQIDQIDFIDLVSDRLKHPSTKIRIALEMLKHSTTRTQRQKYIQIIESQCGEHLHLIDNLLTLYQIKNKLIIVDKQRVNLLAVIQSVINNYEDKWREKGIILNLVYSPRITCFDTDVTIFQRVLQELLNNAGKFAPQNTHVQMDVRQTHNQLILSLTNHGNLLSPQDQQKIFTHFTQGENLAQITTRGMGTGLAIVKSFLEYLGGKITVSSNYLLDNSSLAENCFTITIPVQSRIESENISHSY